MEAVTTLPRNRPLRRSDLASAPDDGHRYEIIDGALIVTPAPSPRHQIVAFALARLLADAAPPALRVLMAPVDVVLAEDTVLQPDVLVASKHAFTEAGLIGSPVLAVEVLSPSTHLIDLNTKKAAFEHAGCASYWVVDPVHLRLLTWNLRDGAFVEGPTADGPESAILTEPFPVTISPAALAD